jgi:hypothetical protein
MAAVAPIRAAVRAVTNTMVDMFGCFMWFSSSLGRGVRIERLSQQAGQDLVFCQAVRTDIGTPLVDPVG